ncbi:MAG: hypothetical protein IK117_06560 [Bacteroidales bacterium]|nr:hypothetical protein [Bacteroidales bacterium]
MQHSKKKTNVASEQPKQAQPARPAQAPTSTPTAPKIVQEQPKQQPQAKPQPAPSQNFMADIMSGKVVPQQSAPKPTQTTQPPQPAEQPVAQPQTVPAPTEEKKSYISNKDKFEALSKENPLLIDLKKKFDLNLN